MLVLLVLKSRIFLGSRCNNAKVLLGCYLVMPMFKGSQCSNVKVLLSYYLVILMLHGSKLSDAILLDRRCTSLTTYVEGSRTNVDLAIIMFMGPIIIFLWKLT